IVANLSGNSVSVLLGNANGTFLPAQTFATGASPMDVHVADLNRDGKPDLAYVNHSDSVGVMLGNGDGTFQAQKTLAPFPSVVSVDIGDMNRDGLLDLV